MNLPFVLFGRYRYLSGLDWVIACLDAALKRAGGTGNSSQIVMTLDPAPDAELLRAQIAAFLRLWSVLRGYPSRHALNLAPCWVYPEKECDHPEPLRVHEVAAGGAWQRLVELANEPFASENVHLAFNLVREGGIAHLALRFDHRVLDARGAERFMELLGKFMATGDSDELRGQVNMTAESGLTRWKEKFMAGQTVNRRFIALGQTEAAHLNPPETIRKEPFQFRHMGFDEESSARIEKRAASAAGPFMEMPYILSAALTAMAPVFHKRGIAAPAFIVPVTVDTRPQVGGQREVFFNFSSFLFIRVAAETIKDRAALIAEIKREMYEQAGSGLPKKLAEASMLMRIAPLRVLGPILAAAPSTRMSAFTLGYVGRSIVGPETLPGYGITNLVHMPRVPYPPGIGVFANRFGKRLNITCSWHRGMIEEVESEEIEAGLRELL